MNEAVSNCKYLLVEIDGGVATVTLNRPEVLNNLNKDVLAELASVFAQLETQPAVKAVIITGQGRAFCAGGDIATQEALTPATAKEWARYGQDVLLRIESFPRPVIAAVNGYALGGGCELAMACDIRLAASSAKFGQPEVNLGIIPGFAGSQRLPRLVGKGRAKLLVFSGDIIDAGEALAIGLADKVLPPEQLLPAAKILAMKIAAKAPFAMKQAKQAINQGLEMDFASASAWEAECFAMCFTQNDQKEGMRAFLEKRKAEFSGD